MKVSQLFDKVYEEELGYVPSTANLKPAHVANGFARSILQKTYETTSIQKVVRDYGTKKDHYKLSSDFSYCHFNGSTQHI